MVITTWTPNFVSDNFFSTGNRQKVVIAAAYIADNSKGKKEVQIEVDNGNVQQRMSVWGSNHKFLIEEFGNDTDGWIGKVVYLEHVKNIDGKWHKVIRK